jgi:hypothetical protein
MSGCTSCQGGLWSFIASKLGRCPKCMRASVRGTLVGWTVSAAIYLIWPHPILVGLGVLVATSFTVLLIAHLVAFTARIMAFWATMRASAPTEMQKLWPTRRAFLVSALGAALAAFLPPALGQRAERVALAQGGCPGNCTSIISYGQCQCRSQALGGQPACGAQTECECVASGRPPNCSCSCEPRCRTRTLAQPATFSDDHPRADAKAEEKIVDKLDKKARKHCEPACQREPCALKQKCDVSGPIVKKEDVTFGQTANKITGTVTIKECPCACK